MRIIRQSKNNRGMSTNMYRNRKREWIMRKKRNISKIKIELDQENNKYFCTILFAAKERGGLILYLYLKESLLFYCLAFVLICFGPGLDFGYSLERFIEVVLTCTHNLCFEQK